MLKNYFFLVLGLSALSGLAWSSNSATYEKLFKDSIISDAQVNGDVNIAQAYADCHMTAMGIYPAKIQQAVYSTASNTGDYAQARKAFTQVIIEEMAAGPERKAAINSIIEESKAIGEVCLDGLGT